MITTPMKVPKSAITERKLRKILQEAINKNGTSTGWAIENEITPQAVSAFERQIQSAGLQIPAALGYKPALVFIPVDEEDLAVKPPSRLKETPPTKDEVLAKKAKDKKKAVKSKDKDKKKKKSK